jgi:hypothetical protein
LAARSRRNVPKNLFRQYFRGSDRFKVIPTEVPGRRHDLNLWNRFGNSRDGRTKRRGRIRGVVSYVGIVPDRITGSGRTIAFSAEVVAAHSQPEDRHGCYRQQ